MSRTARVLVVDDERHSNVRCSEVLGAAGCEVSTATDPTHGLELVEQHLYDFVLLDAVNTDQRDEGYLRRLKARAPRASIIVLADRPTVDEAVRSMRNGASDYLAKPLEPQRLLAAVQLGMRDLQLPPHAPFAERRAIGEQQREPWQPASSELRFRDEVWTQGGTDGSQRLGIRATRLERSETRLTALAQRGASVREGLPFAQVVGPDGAARELLAPFDGVVLEARAPQDFQSGLAAARPHEAWLARVQPLAPSLPPALARRQLVWLDPRDDSRERVATLLRDIGLSPRIATTPQEAVHALHCSHCDTLMINGEDLGPAGPEQLRWILDTMPGTRAVVLGDPTGAHEGAWRSLGIAYYATTPVDPDELSDLFACMHRERRAPPRYHARPHQQRPAWIHSIETTNGCGRGVLVVATGTSLPAEHGVGLHLVNTLLNHCRPISTGLGARAPDAGWIRQCLAAHDRVVVLSCQVGQGVPGSLLEEQPPALGWLPTDNPRLMTLTFRADPEHPEHLVFRDRTSAAVAGYIHRCIEGL